MNDCCAPKPSQKTAPCPFCQSRGHAVQQETLLHMLKYPQNTQTQNTNYFFCTQQNCEVVYFNFERQVFTLQDVSIPVGQKSTSSERMICYCFHLSEQQILDEQKQGINAAKEFVIQQTKNKTCECVTHNPSGKCCLRDFPIAK